MSPTTIITHARKFHADDVFSYVLLKSLFTNTTLIRTKTVSNEQLSNPTFIVFDIGMQYSSQLNNYDHHQRPAPSYYANGIPKAALGLLWEHFGSAYLSKHFPNLDPNYYSKIQTNVERKFIMALDGFDNGYLTVPQITLPGTTDTLEQPSVTSLIASYNPAQEDALDSDFDSAFLMAANAVAPYFHNVISHTVRELEAQQILTTYYMGGEVLELLNFIPWHAFAISKPDIKFVVFPRTTNDYVAVQVPLHEGSLQGRASFPVTWRGLAKTTLQQISGVRTAEFCHASGFLAVATTRDGILQMVQLALKS